jgi:rhamnulokinase
MTTLVAVDLGAQSGRVAMSGFDGERLSIRRVHSFPNVPVRVHETLYWDVLRLYDGVLEGLRTAARETSGRVDSVGIDTWGVDFALLDGRGRLVQNPVHHRDARSGQGMEFVLGRVAGRELYERTGIQLMPINTIFQLGAMVAEDDRALEHAETLVLVPDLLNYWLSGAVASEFTNATTTACFDPRAGVWAADLLARLRIPTRLFREIVPPGTVLGRLRDNVAEGTRLAATAVVATATHDTASAVAAVPFRRPDAAYISAGTWSLVGVEITAPLIDDSTFAANLTNEGGVGGTFRLLRNVTGLWLVHECRRSWALDGLEWSFDELVTMAEQAPPMDVVVDPDDPSFAAPDDMPKRIGDYCARTGQTPPESPGKVVRCALEGIALAHRRAISQLAAALGREPPEIHVLGGGARNRLLCQWTADATGLPVLAGPADATEIGNLLVQALALGELASVGEAREVVRASFPPTLYEPSNRDRWDEAYARFEEIGTNARAAEEALTR